MAAVRATSCFREALAATGTSARKILAPRRKDSGGGEDDVAHPAPRASADGARSMREYPRRRNHRNGQEIFNFR